jgi:hypothetical protein
MHFFSCINPDNLLTLEENLSSDHAQSHLKWSNVKVCSTFFSGFWSWNWAGAAQIGFLENYFANYARFLFYTFFSKQHFNSIPSWAAKHNASSKMVSILTVQKRQPDWLWWVEFLLPSILVAMGIIGPWTCTLLKYMQIFLSISSSAINLGFELLTLLNLL